MPTMGPRSSQLALSKVNMQVSEEVLEKLKTMTLTEATDLFHEIEATFDVGEKKDDKKDDEPADDAPAEE